MARRSGFNDDDMTVLDEALSERIEAHRKTDAGIDALAPLFRVREKVLAMKGKSNGSVKATAPAKQRAPKPAVQLAQPRPSGLTTAD